MIEIDRLDHLVLTVASISDTMAFYEKVLGFSAVQFGAGRVALAFGQQKINLHEAGREFEPKAARPTAGSADVCFVASTPLEDMVAHLKKVGVTIEAGPIARTGATGAISSVHIRDPDHNLVEVSNYIDP